MFSSAVSSANKPAVLERATNAAGSYRVRCQGLDLLSAKEDAPCRSLHVAGDGVEQGGLAGAVRADQCADLASVDAKGHVVDRD